MAGDARDAVLRERVPVLRKARMPQKRQVDEGELYERRVDMYGDSETFDEPLERFTEEEEAAVAGPPRRAEDAIPSNATARSPDRIPAWTNAP